MSNEIVRYLVGGFLIVHGLGHAGGYWFFIKSWLSPALVDTPIKWLFVVLWIAAMVCFLVGGVALLQLQTWWRCAAIGGALLSIVVAALYIQSPALNAAVADVVILLAILALNWPSPDVVGA